jgi:hypothetical protein
MLFVFYAKVEMNKNERWNQNEIISIMIMIMMVGGYEDERGYAAREGIQRDTEGYGMIKFLGYTNGYESESTKEIIHHKHSGNEINSKRFQLKTTFQTCLALRRV